MAAKQEKLVNSGEQQSIFVCNSCVKGICMSTGGTLSTGVKPYTVALAQGWCLQQQTGDLLIPAIPSTYIKVRQDEMFPSGCTFCGRGHSSDSICTFSS